jgi:hypothetical protein
MVSLPPEIVCEILRSVSKDDVVRWMSVSSAFLRSAMEARYSSVTLRKITSHEAQKARRLR